jgi:hypothetical protein
VNLFLQSPDVVGLIIGGTGAFLVMLKVLDMAKNKLGDSTKNS